MINPILPVSPQIDISSTSATQRPTGTGSFSDVLNKAIEQVDQLQKQSDAATEALAAGQPIDLHTVMIATQQAELAVQLTVQVRNKAVEAYQEIMRMQL